MGNAPGVGHSLDARGSDSMFKNHTLPKLFVAKVFVCVQQGFAFFVHDDYNIRNYSGKKMMKNRFETRALGEICDIDGNNPTFRSGEQSKQNTPASALPGGIHVLCETLDPRCMGTENREHLTSQLLASTR